MSAARQQPVPMRFVGIKDTFAESGKPEELLARYGIDAAATGVVGPGAIIIVDLSEPIRLAARGAWRPERVGQARSGRQAPLAAKHSE